MGLGAEMGAVSPGGFIGVSTDAASGSSDEWRWSRIKTIKRLLTGEKTDEEMAEERRERLYHLRHAAEVRVANLRSLSDSAKIRMARKEAQKFEDERHRIYLKNELKNLLKGE